MQLTSKAKIDSLHVTLIFTKLFPRTKASRKSNEALQSEGRDRQRLSRAIQGYSEPRYVP